MPCLSKLNCLNGITSDIQSIMEQIYNTLLQANCLPALSVLMSPVRIFGSWETTQVASGFLRFYNRLFYDFYESSFCVQRRISGRKEAKLTFLNEKYMFLYATKQRKIEVRHP